jgi:hypothetical protein
MFCNTIEKFKKYIPSAIHGEYDKYEAEIIDSNAWFKREIIGSVLYDLLLETSSGNDLYELIEKTIPLCEAVVARKAYLEGIPSFDLTETTSGFVVSRNDNQVPASPERVKKLMDSLARRLSDSIEDLLEYLEENEQFHDAWKGTKTYTLLTDTYIHTLRDYRRYAPYPGSRIDWIADKPKMLNVMRLKIEPYISEELSDEILEELRDNDLNVANAAIIENLRFAYANFVSGDPDAGQSYLMKVRNFIIDNIESYDSFANSKIYQNYLETVIEKNNKNKPIFRAGF